MKGRRAGNDTGQAARVRSGSPFLVILRISILLLNLGDTVGDREQKNTGLATKFVQVFHNGL